MTDSLDDMLKRSRELVAMFEAADALTALIEAREAHTENARILGYLVNELQGRVEAGKLAAVVACWNRSKAARDSIDALGEETQDER